MGMFNKGFEAVREEKKRQDEARSRSGKSLFRLFLTNDGDEAEVQFFTEEPVTFMEHTVKTIRNGKECYDSVICQGENCPLCDSGDRPSFKGAFLVWDKRPYEYTDKDGSKKKKNGSMKLYVAGTRILSQLDRISTKYGLMNRDITIVRIGKGTNTTYTIEKGDSIPAYSSSEITNMLPEKLREYYKGTDESLYSVVEASLTATMGSDDDSDETETVSEKANKNLVGVNDEDDEPVESPKSSGIKKSAFAKKGFKPKENSVKGFFKEKK